MAELEILSRDPPQRISRVGATAHDSFVTMLSIIVAVHNQLGHNTLFLDGVRRFTTGPYEVIVVDNHSTMGRQSSLRLTVVR